MEINSIKIIISSVVFASTSLFAAAYPNVRDDFNTVSYSNSDGTVNFGNDWYDSEDQDPTTGRIWVANGYLNFQDLDSEYIYRGFDASSASGVAYSMEIKTDGLESEALYVGCYDSGNSQWVQLQSLTANSGNGTLQGNFPAACISSASYIGFASDSSGWTTTANASIGYVNFDLVPDTDGDGIADNIDIDDDNDGIPDTVEWTIPNLGLSGLWTDQGNALATGNIGTTNINFDSAAGNGSTNWTYKPNDPINSNGGPDLWSNPDIVNGANALYFTFENATVGDTRTLTVTFSQPQTHVVVHFDRIGGSDGYNANSIELTLSNSDVTLTRLSGNDQFIADSSSKKIYRDTTTNLTDPESTSNADSAAAGSVAFESTTPFTQLTFDVAWLGSDGSDALEVVFEGNFSTAADTDGDGINDDIDLDSDNDGIPDNVEAQATAGYTAPTGTDTDGDGLDDAYDPDNGGTTIVPADTDGDGQPDTLDSDSDNDGYTDCEEGNNNAPSNGCPVTSVEANGLVSWAGGGTDYTDVNGNVDTPSSDLFNETGNTDEVGYREFLCGKALTTLTANQWKLISVPCDTGSNDIVSLFGTDLGTYGDSADWVMYKQTGDDSYEVNPSHKNTNKTMLAGNDTLEQGKSYWIITNADHTVTIPKTLNGLLPTSTKNANDSTIGINDPDFTEVHQTTIPSNYVSQSGNDKKYMAGNVFPYAFNLRDLYFSHGLSAGSYYPMGDSSNDSYIKSIVYTHDSTDTSGDSVSSGGGYIALDPATPGFDTGSIRPMEGFFIKLLGSTSDQASNAFAFPLNPSNKL